MNDAVFTPHVNKYTCGTGKWSGVLAEQLGVPLRKYDLSFEGFQSPLVSTRLSEIYTLYPAEGTYDLIIHDWDYAKKAWVERARRIWAVTPELVRYLQSNGRPDAQVMPCPSSLRGNPNTEGVRVLLFGMAHKRQMPWLVRLRDLLERQGAYTVLVSTAVHEGSPFDRAMAESDATYRELFGDHLRMLGFLADDALLGFLRTVDCCALFYDPAVRANNTTIWAALAEGCPVVTNLDADSPSALRQSVSVCDIGSMPVWPMQWYRTPTTSVPQWSEVVEALACPVNS